MERQEDQVPACPVCGKLAVAGHSCADVDRPTEVDESPSPDRSATCVVEGSFVGKLLGENYRVVAPLGAGAMGMVYVVEHTRLGKRFAAKLLSPDLAQLPQAMARFETEARAASLLDHENIVSVIDCGRTDDGFCFLIMELLRGTTLQARMDHGPLSLDQAATIVIQVCRALGAAHEAGIVHRDIKPDNIFLTRRPGGQPLVKVLDFGIAKWKEPVREGRITRQGQLLGSPEYMSPEASRGDEVDPRADTYAVGVLLYELLCGEVPFRHRSSFHLLQMQVFDSPRPPRELSPHLPEEVERLIMRALEKDPGRRHPNIQALELELMAAVPDAAQRVLYEAPAPALSGSWERAAPASALSWPWGRAISASAPAIELGTDPGRSQQRVASSLPPPVQSSTIDVRPRGQRALLVALWSAAAIMTVIAVVLTLAHRVEDHQGRPGPEAGAGAAEPIVIPEPAAIPGGAIATSGLGDAVFGQIRLRIDSSPPGARAVLDGKPLGRTPIDILLPASDADGHLVLELSGHQLATRWVRLDRDGELELSLARAHRR